MDKMAIRMREGTWVKEAENKPFSRGLRTLNIGDRLLERNQRHVFSGINKRVEMLASLRASPCWARVEFSDNNEAMETIYMSQDMKLSFVRGGITTMKIESLNQTLERTWKGNCARLKVSPMSVLTHRASWRRVGVDTTQCIMGTLRYHLKQVKQHRKDRLLYMYEEYRGEHWENRVILTSWFTAASRYCIANRYWCT